MILVADEAQAQQLSFDPGTKISGSIPGQDTYPSCRLDPQ